MHSGVIRLTCRIRSRREEWLQIRSKRSPSTRKRDQENIDIAGRKRTLLADDITTAATPLGMCTHFTLKHITCSHQFWVKRLCHRGSDCTFQTKVETSKGGECWECDPGQAPPAAIFSDGKKIDVIWGRVEKKKSRSSPRVTGST